MRKNEPGKIELLFADNNFNVSLIECLLEAGAKLDARTAWGDTAIHYAARWGTDKVMEFLLNEGIAIDKPCGKRIHLKLATMN